MSNCIQNESEKDSKRFRSLAASLPLVKGTIIKEDGTRVDISDLFEVPVSEVDPQLAKAQNIYPYIRDLIVLEDGRTCSLLDILEHIVSGGDSAVKSEQLRLTYVELSDKDWLGE